MRKQRLSCVLTLKSCSAGKSDAPRLGKKQKEAFRHRRTPPNHAHLSRILTRTLKWYRIKATMWS